MSIEFIIAWLIGGPLVAFLYMCWRGGDDDDRRPPGQTGGNPLHW